MARSRTFTAIAGLVLGLVVSVAAWIVLETLLLFLFLPFVPVVMGWGRGDETDSDTESVKQCPSCSFRSTDPTFDYCPRDGRRLREVEPPHSR